MSKFFRINPLIRICLFFIAGILIAEQLPGLGWIRLALILAFLFLFFISLCSKKYWKSLWLSLLFLALGIQQGKDSEHTPVTKQKSFWIEPLQIIKKEKGIQLEARVYSDSFSGSGKKASLFFYQVDSLPLDRWIQARLHLKLPSGSAFPGDFNYRQFLRTKNIVYTGFVGPDDWQSSTRSCPFSFERQAFQVQEKLSSSINQYLTGDAADILCALLLGDKSELNENTRSQYQKSGTMHMLAVSGMHVGILYLILIQLFRFIPFPWIRFLFTCSCLWTFAFITGLSPSVMRAVLLFSLMHSGILFHRKVSSFNMLAASALILVLHNPDIIYSVGFQLSYLAVLGILILTPVLNKRFNSTIPWVAKIQSLIHVSLAAQLFTTPLALYYFGQFPLYFLLGNLLVVPLAAPMLCGGIMLLITSPFPKIASFLGYLLNKLIDWNMALAAGISDLPFSSIRSSNFDTACLILLYAIILLGLQFIIQKKRMSLAAILVSLLLFFGLQITRNRKPCWLIPLASKAPIVCYSDKDNQQIFHDTSAGRAEAYLITRLRDKKPNTQSQTFQRSVRLSTGKRSILVLSDFSDSGDTSDIMLLHPQLRFSPNKLLERYHFRKLVLYSERQMLGPWPDRYDLSTIHILEEDGYLTIHE